MWLKLSDVRGNFYAIYNYSTPDSHHDQEQVHVTESIWTALAGKPHCRRTICLVVGFRSLQIADGVTFTAATITILHSDQIRT